jgi:hypothetical protein
MTNPRVNLTQATRGAQDLYAYLEDIVTGERYEFLYNPSEYQWAYTQELTKLRIPGTNSPVLVSQGTEEALTLPITIHTHGLDIRPQIEGLKRLVRPVPGAITSPVVRLVFGTMDIPRLQVASVNLTITGTPGGTPDKATGTLGLLASPAVAIAKVEKINTTPSPRERTEGKVKIQDKVSKDAAFAKKLGISTKAVIGVDSEGRITASEPSAAIGPQVPKILGPLKQVLAL